MSYVVIDDYLSAYDFDRMVKRFSTELPWYYNDNVIHHDYKNESIEELYNFQFTHAFYRNHVVCSNQFGIVEPIIEKLDPLAIIRIKANLNPCADKIVNHGFHIDIEKFFGKSAVFYLNTNNGKTIFEDGTSIDSVANRMLIFDSDLMHTGTTCTDQKCRIIINFNYIEKNK